MPLGLLSLAASLKVTDVKTEIYKPRIRILGNKDFKLAAIDILSHNPTLIGFSTWCITYPASLLIAEVIKKMAPSIGIIFGGPQASVVANETLEKFPFIDFILAGEADISLPQFVKEYLKDEPDFSVIPKLIYRNKYGYIQKNKTDISFVNVEDLPIPAYDLIPRTNWLKLDVGRGCPFECNFCSTSDFFSKKYRVKSAERIIAEMMTVHRQKKITSFSFAHDMFTLNRKFIFELCEKLISLGINNGIHFKWNCSARIDCVSEDLIQKMKAAGCSDIFFGIETGSQRLQKIIKKNLDVGASLKIADVCRKTGIRMHASFIIGFPEETSTDLNQTLNLALKLATKGALTQVSELSLLPGTPLFTKYHQKLRFDGHFSNFSRNYCSIKEIQLIKKYPEIFSSFYYLPVKTVTRNELIFLRFVINAAKDFRNTLFLLSDFLEKDIENINLLSAIKQETKNTVNSINNYSEIVMMYIKFLTNYINVNRERIGNDLIDDVFEYESYSALLLILYSNWNALQSGKMRKALDENFMIRPNPIWKIINSKHKLDNVLPSENNWEENTKSSKKGSYCYLIIADSTTKCKRIHINKTEKFLLESLSFTSFNDFVLKTETVEFKKELVTWLRKMEKIGVVELE